jgi:hypothetical protein
MSGHSTEEAKAFSETDLDDEIAPFIAELKAEEEAADETLDGGEESEPDWDKVGQADGRQLDAARLYL